MAEKITVAELDLDTDAFIAAATKTKSAILNLKDANKKLDTSRSDGRAQLVKNEVALSKLNKTYGEQKKVLSALTDETNKYVSAEKAATTAIDKQNKSIADARKNNQDLNKIRNQLNTTTKEGQKQLKLINQKLDENNKMIKENVDQYTQQKINIGNYASALAETNPILAKGIGLMTQMKEALVAQKAAMNASTASVSLGTKALKIFRLALISTGIGVLVVALGSLVTWLTNTQEGMDKVSRVMAGVSAAFKVIVDRVSKLGEGFSKLLSGDISGFFDSAKESVEGLNTELKEEIALAIKLEGILQKVEKSEINLDIARSAANKTLKELNLTAEDVSKTDEERFQATVKYAEIEQGLVKQEVSNQEKRVAAMLGFAEVTDEVRDILEKVNKEGVSLDQLGLGESTIEDAKEFRDEVVKLNTLQTASFELQTTNNNKLNILKNTIRNKEIKAQKEQLSLIKKEEEERLASAEKAGEDKIAADEAELQRLSDFENRKRDLQNEIDIQNADTAFEKEILKAEQDLEKKTLALEQMQLDAEERAELLALLTEKEEQVIADIRAKWAKKSAAVQIIVDKKVLESDKRNAQAREQVASALTGVLVGLLGEGLGAKLAAIAIDAAIQAGLVQINASAGMASNLSNAATVGPPPVTAAMMAAAGAQNIVIQSQATSAITSILASAAISGLGTIAGSALSGKGFYEGGIINDGEGIPFGLRNAGGDDVLIQAKRGEVVLNESQQRRAGGDGFFSSIGVPGFATGGRVDNNLNSYLQSDSSGSDDLIKALKESRVVAIVDDIREGVNQVVEIEDGANI